MAYEVTMPQMGYDMVDGVINRWTVAEGDRVERGDIIASIATEKADIDIEAYAAGILRRILVLPGTRVAVGTPIGLIADADEVLPEGPVLAEAGAAAPAAPAAPAEPPPPAPDPPAAAAAVVRTAGRRARAAAAPPVAAAPATPEPPPPSPSRAAPGGWSRVAASPLARRRARELGVDLALVAGTGPGGRITAEDVAAAAAGTPVRGPLGEAVSAPRADPTDPYELVPLTRMREAIARRMAEANATIPHFYLTTVVDMEACARLREELNALGDPTVPHFSFNDFVIRAMTLTLQRHPALNAGWAGNELRRYRHSNVAIAVALPDGLVAPTMRQLETVSFAELARRAHDLAARAKTGQLRGEEVSGGHTAISNLGMFGITEFSAIVTPGQGSVLAVGEVIEAPGVRGGVVVPVRQMTVTLAIDHRVTDGAQGAEALGYLRWCLEHPTACLL